MNRKTQRLNAHQRQIARLDRKLTELTRRSNRYTWARLVVFLVGMIVSLLLTRVWGWLAGGMSVLAWSVFFNLVARFHHQVQASITQHKLWRSIKSTHIARMRIDWAHLPPAAHFPTNPSHPFELDLDLIGDYSLHRLLDTSTSRNGQKRLREWLSAIEPAVETILDRQALVHELTPLASFRDRLQLNASLTSTRRWQGENVYRWLAQHTQEAVSPSATRFLTLLALIYIPLFALSSAGVIPPLWAIPFLLYAGIYLSLIHRLRDPFDLALSLRDPLQDLKAIFTFLETYRYGNNARLSELCKPFLSNDSRPSMELRKLSRVLSAASVRRNPLLWMIISCLVPWDLYVTHWLNRRRVAIGASLPVWLDSWFELEALCSLATFSYLNPDYACPSLMQITGDKDARAPLFEGTDLGHPLIPDHMRVCNDFALKAPGDVVLITGSNMSGKSTFLRTLGINLCLAYAGGPVTAHRLSAVPLRLFTSIRVTDSVTDGISYFYAEVKRLRALLLVLQTPHPRPLLFLIDEIFRGTNNRERLIGSRSLVRALAGESGIGVISTHDLELVKLADELPHIANFHFEETISDKQMLFDYRLRSGPCPTTNALRIMAMEGLPVDPDEEPTTA